MTRALDPLEVVLPAFLRRLESRLSTAIGLLDGISEGSRIVVAGILRELREEGVRMREAADAYFSAAQQARFDGHLRSLAAVAHRKAPKRRRRR